MSVKERKTKGTPGPIDIHVGKQLRVRRSLVGLSQEKLAKKIGITFQQIQKYERGTNRVSAERLYQFSGILEVPINYFYEGAPSSTDSITGFADNEQEGFISEDVMSQKETLDLVRTYYSIENPDIRKDMIKLIKSMAKNANQTKS